MSHAASAPRIRPAAVAGMFYPENGAELRRFLDTALQEATIRIAPDEPAPAALIAPHAGYIYSGPIAASAYARIAHAREVIRRVVLIGPAHRVAFDGLATSSAESFATPLGLVDLDRAAIEQILALPFVHEIDEAHAAEHSLEVHLPFLQRVLDDFTIVPLAMGRTGPGQILEVVERLWDAPRTLMVISSDLSHHHNYETAMRLDGATSRAIESLRPDDIAPEQACGRAAIQAMLNFARPHHLKPRTVDQRNSGDTAGSRDQVVGYGAYVFDPTP